MSKSRKSPYDVIRGKSFDVSCFSHEEALALYRFLSSKGLDVRLFLDDDKLSFCLPER